MSNPPITAQIDRAWFSVWSKNEIKRISVKKITEPKSFEKAGAVSVDGLYSPALGPVKRLNKSALNLFLAQLEALNCGFDHLIDELDDIYTDLTRSTGEGKDESYVAAVLSDKLVKRIQEEKEKIHDFDVVKRPQQRNIVETLSQLFRSFINGTLIKPAKICPNCMEKRTPMYLHRLSAIIFGKSDSNKIGAEPKTTSKKAKMDDDDLEIAYDSRDFLIIKTNEKKFLTPAGAQFFLRKLYNNERRTMERLFHFLNLDTHFTDEEADLQKNLRRRKHSEPVDLFFVDTILVPPSKFRPPMQQRGYAFEGPRTGALSSVMKQSIVVKEVIAKIKLETDEIEVEKLQPKLQKEWKDLQTCVNVLFDNEMDKYSKAKYPGLKQLIDKKEGLFRKNMMGKRVNFAARSVISPDPNISVDQIGVPLVFAKKLSYPEPVTPWNIEKLREYVRNGPDKYPGAMSVVFDDGFTVSLVKESTRESLATRLTYKVNNGRFSKNKNTPQATIVNRHLLTGDVLLFNRQPTLHKPSIMAFRARVLPNEKGFRLHYANCKSFNADFDGDEMNAHLPQSELARSEAYNLASVNYQYLVPKDGSPLGGLIQDHVVAVCILTDRDQFFDQGQYNQLVYCGLAFLEKKLKLEKPALLKPKPLWTGKQIITTVIKNCIPEGKLPPTLNIKSKIGPKILGISSKNEDLSDCHVIIKDGELIKGFMDKSNIGATQYGLVHTCYELYGGETSSAMMSAFARLSTWHLQLYQGFTLGIRDILIDDQANKDRYQSIKTSRTVGVDSAKEALGIHGDVTEFELDEKLRASHADRDPLPMKKLDAAMKQRTDKYASEISDRCLPSGLISPFPANNLQMMIQSGAKGGTVNALQISCLLGQIELEGRRVPLSMSGRTLPSFRPYDTTPKAGGFVTGRFLTGIQPQEFFFHCMAGREGLIDTAVKTSRSGYLQRCLIKHLEGLTVHYDQTVRDSCGSVVQFLYGEDGLDICKSQMLKSKAFPSLVDNHKIISPTQDEMKRINAIKETYEDDVIFRTNEIRQWQEKNGDNRIRNVRGSGFLDFVASKVDSDDFDLDFTARTIEEQEQRVSETIKKYEESKCDVNEEEKLLHGCLESEKTFDSQKIESKSENPGSHLRNTIFSSWYSLSFKEKKKWNKFWELCPDPLISLMNPAAHFGVVPEKLDERIEEFVLKNAKLIVDTASLVGSNMDNANLESYLACEENPELSKSILKHYKVSSSNAPKMTKHEFYNLCYNLYMKMMAQPGEAVGLLAAQSIGEPSTQMTLNTFHFAGRGEMNVTLGIPRLREILMTASAKIGTPSMDLPLLKKMYDEFGDELDEAEVEEQAKIVKLALNAVRLSDVLEYVKVTEQVVANEDFDRHNAAITYSKRKKSAAASGEANLVRYVIHFSVLPSKYYKHEFKTNSTKVLKFIEESFVAQLVDTMLKRQKRLILGEKLFDLSTKRYLGESTKRAQRGNAEGNLNADEDPEEADLDAYNARAEAKEKARDDESSSEEEEEADGDNTAQKIKNRRNQDLDYEEPEDDDMEVGEGEARTAEEEEGDKEVLDEAEDEAGVGGRRLDGPADSGAGGGHKAGAASRLQKMKLKRAEARSDDELEEDEEVDDETTAQVKQQLASEDEQDKRRSSGKSYELAGFEDTSNSRSGLATPAAELNEHDQPAKKRKKVDQCSLANSKFDQSTIVARVEAVKRCSHVSDYTFDTKRERWCQLTLQMDKMTTMLDMGALVDSEARRTYIHRVGKIHRALIVKDVDAKSRGAKCDKMIKTEGVSLLSLVRYNHILDLNAIYSNDIHAIANTYGIEAASQAIRREMANVFAVYGIEVDSRHLSLIADYMTYNGRIRGMNRMSMEASASPFQQMSFESTIRYLKWAAILGLYDDIKSPSAALVFGRPTRTGTGLFTTLSDGRQLSRMAGSRKWRSK